MEGLEETNERSEDPISEAIGILEEISRAEKAKNGTEETMHTAKDDRNMEVQNGEQKSKAIDTENGEIDRSEKMSSEQIFWFKLAKPDIDETR